MSLSILFHVLISAVAIMATVVSVSACLLSGIVSREEEQCELSSEESA
jgi:hypothetical protein